MKDSEKETIYDLNGQNPVSQTTNYKYDSTYLQLTKIITPDSRGRNVITTYKYPNDYKTVGVYQAMVTKNIINPVIEGKTFLIDSTRQISRKYTNYFNPSGTTFYVPEYVETQMGTGATQRQITFNEYDTRGNLKKYTELNGLAPTCTYYDVVGKKDLPASSSNNLTQTTNYDYTPLVGLDKITDPNAKNSYFTYDGFNRLKKVSDDVGGLKEYSYHYKNQTVDNPVTAETITDIGCLTCTSSTSSSLILDKSTWTSASSSGQNQVNVSSNIAWTVTSDQPGWLTVTPSSGSNYGYFTINVTTNGGPSQRVGTITVSGPGVASQTVSVTQLGVGGGTGGCVVTKARLIFRGPNECCYDRLVGAKIQGSNDGTTWTTLYDINVNGTGYWQDFVFSNNTTAYSKVRFQNSTNGWGEIQELEFYNGNTKLTGTWIGNVDGNTNGNWGSSKSLDGDITTGWGASAPGTQNYVGLQLTGCGTSCSSPTPSIAANPTSIGSGQTSTLTASGCSGTITWNDNTTGSTKTVSTTGTYTAICTNNGCSASGSGSVTVGSTGGGTGGCVVTKARLIFRGPNECCYDRLVGAKIQGSNDGTTWTTLYDINVNGTGYWQDFVFSNNTTAYSKVRFQNSTSGWGEIQEIEFYNGNTKLTGTWIGNVDGNTNGNWGSSKSLDGDLTTGWGASAPGTQNYVGLQLTGCGTSCSSPTPSIAANPTSIGSGQTSTLTASGCSGTITWNDNTTGSTKTVSTTGTYTAICTNNGCSASGSGSVTVGSTGGGTGGCVVTKARLIFRGPNECCYDRLVGAKIQGSNDGTTWTTLYDINVNGTGYWQDFVFSNNTTAYSKVRFQNSTNGWGEIQELEFYNGNTKLTGTWIGNVDGNTNGNWGSSKSLDGDITTGWGASAPGTQNYVGLQLTGCGTSCSSPTPSIVANPTSIGSGQTSTLTASGCSGTITWNDNTTGTTKTVSTAGTYTATCTNSGCSVSGLGSVAVGSTSTGTCYKIYPGATMTNADKPMLSAGQTSPVVTSEPKFVKESLLVSDPNRTIWKAENVGGYLKLIANTGKVLSVVGGSSADNSNVTLADYTGGDHQLWNKQQLSGLTYAANVYSLVRKNTDKILGGWAWGNGDANSTATDVGIFNAAYADGAASKWLMILTTCPAGMRVAAIEEHNVSTEGNNNATKVYPNPTDGKITVEFSLHHDESVWLNLYDVQGKAIQIKDVEGKAGQNKADFDLSSHSSGMYFMNLQSLQKNETIKVVKKSE